MPRLPLVRSTLIFLALLGLVACSGAQVDPEPATPAAPRPAPLAAKPAPKKPVIRLQAQKTWTNAVREQKEFGVFSKRIGERH